MHPKCGSFERVQASGAEVVQEPTEHRHRPHDKDVS
jgi:hypothetical protein